MFWQDWWTRDSSFADLFPFLYLISALHQLPTSFVELSLSNELPTFSLDICFGHNLRDSDMTGLCSLLNLLESVRLVEDGQYVRVGFFDVSGTHCFLIYQMINPYTFSLPADMCVQAQLGDSRSNLSSLSIHIDSVWQRWSNSGVFTADLGCFMGSRREIILRCWSIWLGRVQKNSKCY